MDPRHQLRTDSESTVETDALQNEAMAASQRIETPDDLIRSDRESMAVPPGLQDRLAASLRSETTDVAERPWWRRWWDGTPQS